MKTLKYSTVDAEIQKAKDLILSGGVIIYPTDTVYGLGGDATNEGIIDRIYAIKERDRRRPLSIMVGDKKVLRKWVLSPSDAAEKLIEKFLPGPLTLIFRASAKVSKRLNGGGDLIGIRIPNNPICHELLRGCEVPIISTSANPSGRGEPTQISGIDARLKQKVDFILDAGPMGSGRPSTVVDVSSEIPVVRRMGEISITELERVVGRVKRGWED